MKAAGDFEVNLQPLDTYATGDGGINLGRMSIDKIFNGDLTAKSKGEMLSAMTTVVKQRSIFSSFSIRFASQNKQKILIKQLDSNL